PKLCPKLVALTAPQTRYNKEVVSRRRAGLSSGAFQCRSGGIGRRAWFRSMYPQGCGGSSPFFGTSCSPIPSVARNPFRLRVLFGYRGSDIRLFNFESNNWSASGEKRSLQSEV